MISLIRYEKRGNSASGYMVLSCYARVLLGNSGPKMTKMFWNTSYHLARDVKFTLLVYYQYKRAY